MTAVRDLALFRRFLVLVASVRRELCHFREQRGLEVDFLVPRRDGAVALVECKAGRTVTPAMAAPMLRLAGR